MNLNKVLHVGWWTIEFRGGGAIIHVETLMEYLKESGIENSYFCGGRYNLLYPKPYIKKWEKKYATIYELVNSPNLIWSFGNPQVHISNIDIEECFQRVIKEVKPDLIHFHELESLTGSLLELTRRLKIPHIVDVHNYWYLCPQRDLLDTNRKVCTDYNNGIKCATCKVLPSSTKIGWMFVGYIKNTCLGKLIDKKIIRKFYLRRIIHENQTSPSFDQKIVPLYEKRRKFFISELNKAMAIIYPSKRSLDIYSSYGVKNPNSYILLPLNKNYEIIKRKQNYKQIDIIRFGYIGSIIPNKGIDVLIDAFNYLKESHNKCKLYIYGAGEEVYIEKLKKKVSSSNIIFKGKYLPSQINEILDTIDVAIVPSLWEDCSPIVLNELKLSKTPIIGSRIGGIEEAIKHGITGYLFKPGDAKDLAFYMKCILDNPDIINKMMERNDFSFDRYNYIEQIKSIYGKALKSLLSKII